MKKKNTSIRYYNNSKTTYSLLGWMVLVVVLMYPGCLDYYALKNVRITLLLSFGVSAVFFIVKCMSKKYWDRYFWLVTIYGFVLVSSTVYNSGNLVGAILTQKDNSFISLLGMTAAVTFFIRNKNLRFLEYMIYYIEFIISINLLTILLYPGGMYQTGQTENYFLGFENIHITTYVFALGLALVRDKLIFKMDSISKRTMFLIALINLSVFLSSSVATYIAIIIFDMAVLFKDELKEIEIISAKNLTIINITISVMFLFVFSFISKIEFLNYFVVDILGKDMTFMARTYIWDSFLLMVKEKPILGYGVDLDNVVELSKNYMGFGAGTSHAHNQYLTDMYYGGILMLAILIKIVFLLVNRIDALKQDTCGFLIKILFFISVFNWNTESLHLTFQFAFFAILNSLWHIEKEIKVENTMTY